MIYYVIGGGAMVAGLCLVGVYVAWRIRQDHEEYDQHIKSPSRLLRDDSKW